MFGVQPVLQGLDSRIVPTRGTSDLQVIRPNLPAHTSDRRVDDSAWPGSHLRGEALDVPLPWDVERMNAEAHARDRDRQLANVLEEFHRS